MGEVITLARLIDVIVRYPTAFFTVLAGIAVVYWFLIMLGMVDVDSGGLEGVEGLEGAGGDLELDLDADVDLDVDGDSAGDGSPGLVSSLLAAAGLDDLPFTIALSTFSIIGFVVNVTTMVIFESELGSFLAKTAALGATAAVSLVLTGIVARPLKPLFVVHRAVGKRSLVGKVCEIRTLEVNERYGQAEIRDGGAGFLIQVRSRQGDGLTRDDKALIFDYHAADDVFEVIPLDPELDIDLP